MFQESSSGQEGLLSSLLSSIDISVIPDKLYFKIGEVADLLDIKPYVLRYWQTEFREISPIKSRTNQRLYRRKDVELLFLIKHLLYDLKYTLSGAKKVLKQISNEKKMRKNKSQMKFDLEKPPITLDCQKFDLSKQEIIIQCKGLIQDMKKSL